MEIASCRLRLNKVGSDVPLNDVTPAEAMFLHILHGPSNGGLSFGEEFAHIKVNGTAKVKTGTKIVVDKPAVAYKPAVAAKAQVGNPGQPGFVAAVAASPEVPEQAAVSHVEEVLRDRTPAEEYRRLAAKYSGARDKTNKPIIQTIWPDRLNPTMPATFKEIKWQEVEGAGIETAAVNYATGGLATSVVPDKK